MGVPEYAVSIGLVVEGRPALGVVYNPAAGEMHAAVCVDAAEHSAGLTPVRFSVLVGRGEQRWDEVPPLPAGAETRGVGSVAYRLGLIAAGRGDAVLTGYGRAEWDVAAGIALCTAAGLRATGVLGDPLAFNQREPWVPGLLVAAPALHDHLLRHFQSLRRR
jgi:myo-inositol-1(or 4)-monophosphatase